MITTDFHLVVKFIFIWLSSKVFAEVTIQSVNNRSVAITPFEQTQFTSAQGLRNYPHGISPDSPLCHGVIVFEEELYQAYFDGMYQWQRPVRDARKAINVEVHVVLVAVNKVIERDRIVRLTGFLQVEFQDEIHIWNQTYPYVCLDSIHIPESDIWVPEVALLNSERKYELIVSGGFEKLRIFSNGTSNYRPGGTFELYCKFDLTYMPFDQQTCTMEFESWRYVSEYQTLSFHNPPLSIFNWLENEEWSMERFFKTNKTRSRYLSESVYDHITLEFFLTRKTGFYWTMVIVPSLFISIAKLSIFALPIDNVIKVHVQFTCLLAYGVFQLMIQKDVPKSSDHIPLISYYIDLSMGYICIAILGEGTTFICLRVSRDKKHKRSLPDWAFVIAEIVAYPLFVSLPIALQEERKENKNEAEMAPSGTEIFFDTHQHSSEFSTALEFDQLRKVERAANDKFMMTYSSMLPLPIHAKLNPELSAGIKDRPEEEEEEDRMQYLIDHKKKDTRLQKWLFLAHVIDRFTLYIYLFCTIISPIVLFGLIPATLPKVT